MDLTRFVAGGMLSHVKRDLVAVIKIIEIHTCSMLVSGSTNVSQPRGPTNKIHAIQRCSIEMIFLRHGIFIFSHALQFFAKAPISRQLLVAN